MTGLKKTRDTACWDCEYRRDFGNSFLGVCTWFEMHGKGANKEIPPALVDKGCAHWKAGRK